MNTHPKVRVSGKRRVFAIPGRTARDNAILSALDDVLDTVRAVSEDLRKAEERRLADMQAMEERLLIAINSTSTDCRFERTICYAD